MAVELRSPARLMMRALPFIDDGQHLMCPLDVTLKRFFAADRVLIALGTPL